LVGYSRSASHVRSSYGCRTPSVNSTTGVRLSYKSRKVHSSAINIVF